MPSRNYEYKFPISNSSASRTILVILEAAHQKCSYKKKFLEILSNDTDVLELLLYYINEFISNGLSKLWMKFGTGDSSRLIL